MTGKAEVSGAGSPAELQGRGMPCPYGRLPVLSTIVCAAGLPTRRAHSAQHAHPKASIASHRIHMTSIAQYHQ
jgi:hypothetical protein